MAVESPGDGLDLEGLCEFLATTSVEYAVLFGSHAREDATPESDVDVALQFPADLDDRTRFDRRNRIDAALQSYASSFVDVADVERLPPTVALRALRDGRLLVGGQDELAADRERFEREVGAASDDRERERREFVDRLAEGET